MIGRMATAANEVSTIGLVDTKRTPGLVKRRNWSEAFKRQVVAETLEPGSSVSVVARRHDVNANQLFKWRRELLPKEAVVAIDNGQMVPVAIVPEPERRQRRRRVERAGFIEIELGSGARVRVRGEVAPKTLRQVIELLR
jgi:transposase